MGLFKFIRSQKISITPRRLYHGLPSILLGTLFNILDAVSTGLLVFPSDGATFKTLQAQAMSMYLMSTVLSQIAMTMGGSLFPGALGAMLIEILPFLRGIGSDLQRALGDDSPALIPTVMFAYALTSFLIGVMFIALGVFKAGLVIAYVPRTVLNGIIGGIGVSLIILGLGIPFPASSPALSLTSAGSLLFSVNHLPLFFASFLPASILSISIRSELLRRCTMGATKHAFYVPIYLILIPAFFWIVVVILHRLDAANRATLVKSGWLFEIHDSVNQQGGVAWNYWTLFDFSKVEHNALKSATTNIVLVVVIGVLNLPVYLPALGLALQEPVNMNHEFIGQGAANVLAGMAGTVPNVLQLSYSVFFSRAGGGRFEAGIVTALTFVFFFISSLVLPYVPTILASVLVLFLGIELTLEAVWESSKTLSFAEWLVVVTTLIACAFLGFAPGFGVGIGAAGVLYLFWSIADTRAHLVDLDEEHGYIWRSSLPQSLRHIRGSTRKSITSDEKKGSEIECLDLSRSQCSSPNLSVDVLSRISVVGLSGYVFFGTIPSLEAKITAKKAVSALHHFMIIDLTNVHRLETSAAQLLERNARENVNTTTVMFCGLFPDSAAYADLHRGGVRLNFGTHFVERSDMEVRGNDILAFEDRAEAIKWCILKIQYEKQLQGSASMISDVEGGFSVQSTVARLMDKPCAPDIGSDEDALRAFSMHPKAQKLFQLLFPSSLQSATQDNSEPLTTLVAKFKAAGGRIRHYEPQQLITTKGDSATFLIFIIQGCVSFHTLHSNVLGYKSRPSFLKLLTSYAQTAYSFLARSQGTLMTQSASGTFVSRTLSAGESFGFEDGMHEGNSDHAIWTGCDRIAVSSGRSCWTIEVHKTESTTSLWPLVREWMDAERLHSPKEELQYKLD